MIPHLTPTQRATLADLHDRWLATLVILRMTARADTDDARQQRGWAIAEEDNRWAEIVQAMASFVDWKLCVRQVPGYHSPVSDTGNALGRLLGRDEYPWWEHVNTPDRGESARSTPLTPLTVWQDETETAQ